MQIREISPEDNSELARVIKSCLEEFDAAVEGTMYTDPSLHKLYEWFDKDRSRYWVIADENQVYGGCGIAPLPGESEKVAELQRMFLSPEARGKGFAGELMELCLDFARKEGFSKIYLETLPQMTAAQKLYTRYGFKRIDSSMGSTGHNHCDVNMLMDC